MGSCFFFSVGSEKFSVGMDQCRIRANSIDIHDNGVCSVHVHTANKKNERTKVCVVNLKDQTKWFTREAKVGSVNDGQPVYIASEQKRRKEISSIAFFVSVYVCVEIWPKKGEKRAQNRTKTKYTYVELKKTYHCQ